jgi:alkylhydroperoxidase/carboxymuconolactone decarboxylase family protein YurZ
VRGAAARSLARSLERVRALSVLAAMVDRPGLPPAERVLLLAAVAVVEAAWERLAECCALARARGWSRAGFEETLLQAVLFCGFPRVVTAFETLADAWPCAAAPSGGALPAAGQRDAGLRLFDAIYGDNAAGVRDLLRSFHGELHDFVIEAAYGRVLARPGLPTRMRELLAVASLAALDQTPQLVAHARGALRFGATAGEVREAAACALPSESLDLLLARVLRGVR